ncbi:MAG: hypothetical protein M3250_03370 [Thermoproteota archaeon]|nr:hypothetical protein [Thermoproteota archaeon]
MDIEKSVIAKSTGQQEQNDMKPEDAVLSSVLMSGKKLSKEESNYREKNNEDTENSKSCVKCKFNLADERMCHVVEGEVNNDLGISNYFSPKGDGMLPGDIVWEFVKKTGRKLNYEEGHVIEKGADEFQCKDCKYYMYSHSCLLINGSFEPEMSCGFVVKIGNGTVV